MDISDHGGNMLSRTKYNKMENCTSKNYASCVRGSRTSYCRYQYLRTNPALIRTRNSNGEQQLSCFHPRTYPSGQYCTRHRHCALASTPCWEAIDAGAGIIEDHSTETKHGQIRPVTLHQADDGVDWFCHGLLSELNVGSPSDRQANCRDIRTWSLVFTACPDLHRLS